MGKITCVRCGVEKIEAFFRKRPSPKVGYGKICKDCYSDRLKANRKIRRELRGMDKNKIEAIVKEANKNSKRIERKIDFSKSDNMSYEKYKLIRKVEVIVKKAIKTGTLVKERCVQCHDTEDICAHHEDYSKPLDVVWLCRSCHMTYHNKKRKIEADGINMNDINSLRDNWKVVKGF